MLVSWAGDDHDDGSEALDAAVPEVRVLALETVITHLNYTSNTAAPVTTINYNSLMLNTTQIVVKLCPKYFLHIDIILVDWILHTNQIKIDIRTADRVSTLQMMLEYCCLFDLMPRN